MDILQSTSRKRETYQVKIDYSLLWESALGIAAITNTPLKDTLERTTDEWQQMQEKLSLHTNHQLMYVEKNNTWKAILQILHHGSFKTLQSYTDYLKKLSDDEMKYICLPFLGPDRQEDRKRAAKGEMNAIIRLQKHTEDNPIFPAYIQFIADVDATELRTHLIDVMRGWYRAIVAPESEQYQEILQRDLQSKVTMSAKMGPEELVEWATGGIQYSPEPSVYRVLLIPHWVYRPWNIEADIEGTKIFYYPVANESIHPSDPYVPSQLLVQKYKALGDENRLKIVKILAENNRSLHELTGLLDMGKSTIHHHLKLLKSARLVENDGSIYTLKRRTIEAVNKELQQFLGDGIQ